jgi:hypothetical protein
VFRGTIHMGNAAHGNAGIEVHWQDWTGTAQDTAPALAYPNGDQPVTTYMYYARGGRGRVIFDEIQRSWFYYIATWGIGVFRRRVDEWASSLQ